VWRSLLLSLAFVAACDGCKRSGGDEESLKKPAVKVATVGEARIAPRVTVAGVLAPLPGKDVKVGALVPGRVDRVFVAEGDAVKSGQALAHVEAEPLRQNVSQAQAQREHASAELQNAKTKLERAERLYRDGIAAKQEVDDARARAQSAGAAASEAEAAARRAQRQVERSAIRSPLAGVIVRLLRRPGELVDGTPTTPIVEVADPSRLELVADVPAADLVRLQKDQTAEVSISALPGTPLTAEVAAVSPSVDRATGLGVVRVALPAGSRLPIGVLGTARVQVGAARASVGVPSPAVRSGVGGDVEVVLCGADGQAHVRRLPHGTSRGGRTETPGLEPGQRVVVSPVLGIADGDPIEIEK
jgi:RND family efflux transporter MFP subunit